MIKKLLIGIILISLALFIANYIYQSSTAPLPEPKPGELTFEYSPDLPEKWIEEPEPNKIKINIATATEQNARFKINRQDLKYKGTMLSWFHRGFYKGIPFEGSHIDTQFFIDTAMPPYHYNFSDVDIASDDPLDLASQGYNITDAYKLLADHINNYETDVDITFGETDENPNIIYETGLEGYEDLLADEFEQPNQTLADQYENQQQEKKKIVKIYDTFVESHKVEPSIDYESLPYEEKVKLAESYTKIKLSPEMNPDDGIIEGFILAREEKLGKENTQLVFYIFLDEDWKQQLNYTNIMWAEDMTDKNKRNIVEFDFSNPQNGIYINKITKDIQWYEDLPRLAGIVIGEISEDNIRNLLDEDKQFTNTVMIVR